jgi:hypothetical protein
MTATRRSPYFLYLVLSALAMAQQTGTFTTTGSMTESSTGYSATLLPNGKVLIAGGQNAADFPLASAELYDPSTGLFSLTGNMTEARGNNIATLLPHGRVLIAGGAFPHVTSAELYDPATGTLTQTGDLLDGTVVSAILLANGKVLFAQGNLDAELYDPALQTFSATGYELLYGSMNSKLALLPDGRALLINCCRTEQLFDPLTGAFSLTGATRSISADGFASAQLANGNVLVSGGFNEDINFLSAAAEFYDLHTKDFVRTASMTKPRFGHTSTTLGDGTILIAGSFGLQPGDIPYDSSAEIYDPATGTFSGTGDMTSGRGGHTATLLLDGRVLIAGSASGGRSAELYTPAVKVPGPALFSLSGDGKGPGALWHSATGQVVSANSPAVAGEALSMYTTSLIPNGALPPQVAIGARLAEVLFFGDAPGYFGYLQVNFRVPAGITPGPAVPVHLTYLGRPSNEVMISLQ